MFVTAVAVLVWMSSLVAVGFGFFHHASIYDPFVLIAACIYVAVVIATRWLHPNRKLTSLLQLFLIVNMVLNGLGTNGLYRTSVHYDDLVHFLSPALLMFAGAAWQQVRHQAIWPAVVFTVMISIGWEPTEMFLDYFFQTQTYGQVGQDWDTFYDILMDLSGMAAALLVYWKVHPRLLRWLNS